MTPSRPDAPPIIPTPTSGRQLAAADRADARPSRGLTTIEAQRLLAVHGPNRPVPEIRRPPLLAWLLRPLADPMVLLLLVAGATYVVLGDTFDAVVILAALIPITLVSLVLETRAERALEKLRRLTTPTARVWRDGTPVVIPSEEIVPGDVVGVQEGDVIPADGTLVEGAMLMVDESALTGESVPVAKDAAGGDVERQAFAGTTVLAGRGTLQVTVTGPSTRYGQIGELVGRIRQPETPLQRLIHRLVWQLAAVAAGFCVAVAALEIAAGHGWAAAIIAGVSLAIAAIPEEFPMVYTLYLTLGAWRLSRDHALVRRLASVETLGATTVICTDKTGTLTVGRMEVASVATARGVQPIDQPFDQEKRDLLEAAVLASEPSPFDPLEQAIVRSTESHGIDVTRLQRGTMLADYPFDPRLKYVAHVWQTEETVRICAKGALEGILERSQVSTEQKRRAIEANRVLANDGLRVIAVAAGTLPESTVDRSTDEGHLHFLGLIAFADPVRPGVSEALRVCREAGVRVIMVTGDHPVTAHAIAEGLGLPHDHRERIATGEDLDAADDATLARLAERVTIFARIRPEQKHRLVKALRERGEVVAMTGDGINDAPALREADIGIAMGQRGTEVARESADLVLLDDNFATIVGAIQDGRRIFENLRRAFSYLIAFHTPLLLSALVIPLTGAPLFLLPVLLIWLELIVHPTASLVFESDPPPPDLMQRPPRRPVTGLLAGTGFIRALAVGLSLSAAVLALYLLYLGYGRPAAEARAIGLTALLVGQIITVLAQRSPTRPLWRASLGGNLALPAIVGTTLLSLILAVYVQPVAHLLMLASPSPSDFLIASVVGIVATLWLEPLKGRP